MIILSLLKNFLVFALSYLLLVLPFYCEKLWFTPIILGTVFLSKGQKRLEEFVSSLDSTQSVAGQVTHTEYEKNPSPESRKADKESIQRYIPAALKILFPQIDGVEHLEGGKGKKGVGYVRVSTRRQAREGESVEAQLEEMMELAKSRGISTLYIFIDAKSGKNFSGRKLEAIRQLAELGEIDEFMVRDVDRIGRESFELLGFIMQLRAFNVLTVTPREEIDVKRLEDMVITSFKAFRAEEENTRRVYTSLSSKILNFRNRKWNMPIPLGYRRRDQWIEKIPEYGPVITDIFQHFLDHKDYGKVAKAVSVKYKDLLQKPLNSEHIGRMLKNATYIGKPVFGGENVRKLFGDTYVDDPTLAFIDEKVFTEVQKIIAAKKSQYQRKKKPIEELATYFGFDILQCLDNVAPICPICNQAMGYNGQSYICPRCKRQRKMIKMSELMKIAEWIIKREKCLKLFRKVLKSVKNPNEILMEFKETGVQLDEFLGDESQHRE
jgi:site-specific DNA recombinase